MGSEAGNFTIEFGGKKYPARQLLADIRSGTAMLKIDAATPALPIGKSEELGVATPVVAIGYPLDLPETPNCGMVAGFDHKCLGRYFSTTHLRVNLPTQRGEAGAPLLNMKGEVVGIVVSSLENNSACYAVPIEAAEKIRSDFVRFGEPRHGWIGINVSEAAQPVEGSRAEMTQIMGGTPAARSGIKSGDDLYAELFGLIELAARFGAGEDVMGFLTHATADVPAERFDFFSCFVARHRRQRSSQHKSLSGQRQFGCFLRRDFFALWLNFEFSL